MPKMKDLDVILLVTHHPPIQFYLLRLEMEVSFSDYSVVRMKAIKESILSERYLAELIVITFRPSGTAS